MVLSKPHNLVLGTAMFTFSLAGTCGTVELVQEDGHYRLLMDGEAYFIKGSGGNGSLEELARAGANSVRTWGDNQRAYLDRAHELGLSVCVGLWIQHERHGFDYSDDAAVEAQIREHCAVIDELKDHPAVLMWAIGNEVELNFTNPRVYDVIEAIARHAKAVDPDHPTMTVVAHAPAEVVELLHERCPSIDILGCNSYGGLRALARHVREAGWDGPYVVTEWGTDGPWEVDPTSWGAEIEPTSTEKADQFRERYQMILDDAGRCLGSYVFHWGNKQENTPTWFNLFLEDGTRMEPVDVLASVWSGKDMDLAAPRTSELRLNGKRAESSVTLSPGETVQASFRIRRGDPYHLRTHWELLRESTDKRQGGDAEQRPEAVPVEVVEDRGNCLEFLAPADPGKYRLFLYLYGADNTVATANFPFRVEE